MEEFFSPRELQKFGFQNIEIEEHQYNSRYGIDKIYKSTRLEKEFYPRGNPLLSLSAVQKDLLQTEYPKTVEQLIANQGAWRKSTTLYVKAQK